ncbi:metal ABC transporter substrate-binding protein [Fimbriiglobus ruber]|nr:zinc ABC transporter substrate-binding protein [Fimbriiglobus ruber]
MFTRLDLPRGAYALLPVFLGLLALIPFTGCGNDPSVWPDKPGPKVVASFPPLYCFAVNVAGDDASVRSVLTNQGVHNPDTKTAELRTLNRADLFFMNGLGLDEKIAARLKGGSGNTRLKLVDLGAGLDKKRLEAPNEHAHEDDEEGHGHHHDHGTTDPHVWLGLDHAITFVGEIRDEFKQIDPAHAADYDRRAAEYTAKLNKLRADGVALLKDKKERKFVTFHESLAYFAKTFNLEIADVIQKVPGKEPSGKALEKLVKTCVENKTRVIAVEPQFSGQGAAARVLDELKRKGITDAVLVEIDPLETAQEADLNADWYETKMRANLDALAKALK